jgi:Fe-S-cluster containining protein
MENIICDCENCKHGGVCCSTDAWIVNLTNDESKIHPHVVTANGIISLASGPDGFCLYRDPETKKCKIYETRPSVCRQFTCVGKEDEMGALNKKHNEIRQNIESSMTGYFVAFISQTNSPKMASSLIIKDMKSQKDLQIMPIQVFGNSEKEIKEKMIDVLTNSFKK